MLRPTFVQIWKKKSVEQFSPVPYLATLINCVVWVLYGLPIVHPHSTLVWTINGAGTAIEIVYLLLFIIYSDSKKRLKVLLIVLVEAIFMAVLTILVLTLVHTTKKRTVIVGIVAIVFNAMMYASPLSVMVSPLNRHHFQSISQILIAITVLVPKMKTIKHAGKRFLAYGPELYNLFKRCRNW